MPFAKLSQLSQFTVKEFKGSTWKKYDEVNKKMLVSPSYQQGYSLRFTLETEHGTLDISKSNMGELLVGVQQGGKADIVGQTYSVKTNGKTGMEIRYFLNPAKLTSESTPQQVIETWETAM